MHQRKSVTSPDRSCLHQNNNCIKTFKGTTGYDVTGNLTLHGETKSITFPADIQISDDQVKVAAEFFIKRFDFGIQYPGRANDLIRDEVVIRLDITAVPE